ncbi:MAG TPA: pyridoxal-phosphate dependent enzyme [Cyclobacteriaceae bacterium]|nr:pyridoxal-phosphate dependent enzyme [Cyclobacteriaceae bacterium]
MDRLNYTETPIEEIHDSLLDSMGVRLLVKREDLNHPAVSGNKWWKLKYNLVEARKLGKKKLLTFGGAYSNHIYATAAAAKAVGMECVGIIRGGETLPLNSTLTFAKAQGMHLHYVSRETYRSKTDANFLSDLREKFGDFYLIPEGGTNSLAINGCEEWGKILSSIDCNEVFLPVGTGGTMAGLLKGLESSKKITAVAVLKSGDFLRDEIKLLSGIIHTNWKVLTQYHHGGYAKTTPTLLEFIHSFSRQNKIPLEPVYSGKMFWALFEEVRKGNFVRGTTLLALHTGGLQTI